MYKSVTAGSMEGIHQSYTKVLLEIMDDLKQDVSDAQFTLMNSVIEYAEVLHNHEEVDRLEEESINGDISRLYYGGLLFKEIGIDGFFTELVCIDGYRPFIFEIHENDCFIIIFYKPNEVEL